MKKSQRNRNQVDLEALLEQKMKELEEMQNFMGSSESFMLPSKIIESIIQEIECKKKDDRILGVLPKKKKCILF